MECALSSEEGPEIITCPYVLVTDDAEFLKDAKSHLGDGGACV
jgi:hypothetical protein